MSEPKSPRRNLRARWISGGLALLALVLFLFQLFGPHSGIVVSKETTFITEPLGADGLPDFKAYYLNQCSEGVTPENNAAVLIWQAMWPDNLSQEYRLPMANVLGLKEMPSGKDSLVDMNDQSVREEIAIWLAEQFPEPLDDEAADKFSNEEWKTRLRDETAYDLIDNAGYQPWTSDQIPLLAKWVEDNRRPLDLLVEASNRPYYYSPSPSCFDDQDFCVLAALMPGVQNVRTGTDALMTRAMWNLGEGRTVECWQDTLACHRLASLMAQGDTLIEQLVAIATDGMACRGTVALLHHGKLKPDLTRQILADLNNLPNISSMKKSFDQGERLMFIDIVILMSQGKVDGADFSDTDNGPMQAVSFVAIDWNFILREGNRWHDRFIAALEKKTREQRLTEFQKINNDLSQLSETISPGKVVGSIFSRRLRSKIMANILVSLLPAFEVANSAEDRATVVLEMTRVAAALAVYRAKHSEYPKELAALVPEILPELPIDIYSGDPFIYSRKDDGGYLLYSVFENGVDDGGTDMGGEIIAGEWADEPSEDFDYDASDMVIRVPEPAFKLPEPPSDEEWPR